MLMELLDVVRWKGCPCVVYIPLPERRLDWAAGKGSFLHILHYKICHCDLYLSPKKRLAGVVSREIVHDAT